jgi:hypothetical protein
MTDQFDGFQLNPNDLGSDWVFSGDQAHANRQPNAVISNYNMYFVGPRMTTDRTRTTLGGPDGNINPPRVIGAGFGGHGVDWAEFNYNPYSKTNPNFRVMNDWLHITGLGHIDVVTDDVMDEDEVVASGMVAYMNYPSEGYSSFGKTTGGASPDKRWTWSGNTWVPAA